MVDPGVQDRGQAAQDRGQALVGEAFRQGEPLGPDDLSVCGVDRRDRQNKPRLRRSQPAFHEIPGAQVEADLLGVRLRRVLPEAGAAGDDRKPAKSRQLVDQVLADALRGDIHPAVARLVLEFEHGHGRSALEPRRGRGHVDEMRRQGRGRRLVGSRLPPLGLGVDEGALLPQPVLEAFLAGKVQALQELSGAPGLRPVILVRRPGDRNVEGDRLQVQAHPRPLGEQQGLCGVGEEPAQVGEFASQAGLGLGRLAGAPELVLQELARALAIPAGRQEGDEPDCLLTRDFHPAPVGTLEAEGPHQPDRVDSGSRRHSNHPRDPSAAPLNSFSRFLHVKSGASQNKTGAQTKKREDYQHVISPGHIATTARCVSTAAPEIHAFFTAISRLLNR